MTTAAVRNCLVDTHRSVASNDRFLRLTSDRSSGAVAIAAAAAAVSHGTSKHPLASSFPLDSYYAMKTRDQTETHTDNRTVFPSLNRGTERKTVKQTVRQIYTIVRHRQ